MAEIKDQAQNSEVDEHLVGLWSSEGPYGRTVDPSTGMITGSVYNGQWDEFRADGTFRIVTIASGPQISGAMVIEGRFNTQNGLIFFTDCKESWYPTITRRDQKPGYWGNPVDSEQMSYQFKVEEGIEILTLGAQDYFYIFYRVDEMKDRAQNSQVDKHLVGLWTSEGPCGDLVDISTGMSTGDIYNRTGHLFRADGTYRLITIASGYLMSGIVVIDGRFNTQNGIIFFTDCKESWNPFPKDPSKRPGYKDKPIDYEQKNYNFEVWDGTKIFIFGIGDCLNSFYWAEMKDKTQNSQVDERLVGLWSSEGPYENTVEPSTGMMVDPLTGMIITDPYNGRWYLFRDSYPHNYLSQNLVYNGQWYSFKVDGTFRNVAIESGPKIRGVSVTEGKFNIQNGIIFFTDCKESWYPNPEDPSKKPGYKDKPVDYEQKSYHFEVAGDTELLALSMQDYFNYFYRAKK